MSRIAKIVALLVVLVVTFSFSQDGISEPMEKKTSDCCITSEKLKEVETFYSNSFKDIQGSYNMFLTCVGIFVAIVCAIATWNWWKAKETLDKASKKLKRLKKKDKKLFGEVEFTYFTLAIYSFEREDYKEHFRRLAEHFHIFTKRKLKPEIVDFSRLKSFDKFIKKYDEIQNKIGFEFEWTKIFLYELNRFIEYGKKKYSKNPSSIELAYLEETEKIWNKLCRIYGKDKILREIKGFNYNNYDYSF